MKRRTEITIDTQRTVVVRHREISVETWCQLCGKASRMVTPAEAARLCATSTRAIYRRIGAGDLHYTEAPSGALLVCVRTLSERK